MSDQFHYVAHWQTDLPEEAEAVLAFWLQEKAIGDEKQARELKDGEVLLLENVRFHKGEEKNEATLAEQLAKLGDVYINDAFGTAHREHSSTFGVPQLLQGKPRAIGFLIQKELKYLGEAVTKPARPFVAILGGAKVSDKINVIEQLLGKADTLLIGGAMAYTFFLAQGKQVGKSLVERDKVELAKSLLAKAGGKIKLPVDTVVSDKMTDDATTQVVAGDIPADLEGFDIGPKTRELYKAEIAKAKTIVWNGPMGVFEKKPFAEGTRVVAQAVADATSKNGAVTVIGGGWLWQAASRLVPPTASTSPQLIRNRRRFKLIVSRP